MLILEEESVTILYIIGSGSGTNIITKSQLTSMQRVKFRQLKC